jgi:hypothetical protein
MTYPGQAFGPDARTQVAWRISSYSLDREGNCVEAGAVADQTGRVAVRHSHYPDGLALIVSQHTWAAFVDAIKNNELSP